MALLLWRLYPVDNRRGNAEWEGERERGGSWNLQVSVVRAVWLREEGQREDGDSVSGVGRARVTVRGVSRGLMEERWKQWRHGKEGGKEVVEPAVFCGQCLD